MNRARAFVELARPQQWTKNSFVFTGLLFAHAWRDADLLAAALLTVLAFCLASSAVYAYNDAADAARDRRHPAKRRRPVARGALTVAQARGFALALGAASLAVAAAGVSARAGVCIALYIALNVAYTQGLKHVPVIDVFLIASGFMLRILAGTSGIGIEPSNWLLLCGLLLTLMLGFGKRRAELEQLEEEAGHHRAVLEDYSAAFLERAVMVCAGGTIVCYALYTVSADTAALHGTTDLVLTLPWVLLGTFRYLFRLHFRGGGGDPTDELLRDPVLAGAALGWAATVVWLLKG